MPDYKLSLYNPDHPLIQKAVREWMSRNNFLEAAPQGFWDDICSEGLEPSESAPAVCAAIERILGTVKVRYEFARHEYYEKISL